MQKKTTTTTFNQDIFKQLSKHLTNDQPSIFYKQKKKLTNNQPNIFNQGIFKQLSKCLTHLGHKVTCYIIN